MMSMCVRVLGACDCVDVIVCMHVRMCVHVLYIFSSFSHSEFL